MVVHGKIATRIPRAFDCLPERCYTTDATRRLGPGEVAGLPGRRRPASDTACLRCGSYQLRGLVRSTRSDAYAGHTRDHQRLSSRLRRMRGDNVTSSRSRHRPRLWHGQNVRHIHVPLLAQHHVHQRAAPADRAIEIVPSAVNLDASLIHFPGTANTRATTTAPAKVLDQQRRDLRLPVSYRLRAEFEATEEKHFGKITEAEFVVQPPKHREGDHVRWILGPVEDPSRPFVELFATIAAAETSIALDRPVGSLRDRRPATRDALQRTCLPIPVGIVSGQTIHGNDSLTGTLTEPACTTSHLWKSRYFWLIFSKGISARIEGALR
jgi:hypothetical protein